MADRLGESEDHHADGQALTPEDVLTRRLATQRVTGPAAPDPVSVVRESLAVQSQDPSLARWSVAWRAGCTDADVRTAIDSGQIVRTHVLRPTWHYVTREDAGWLVELSAAKLESGMTARHRQLGLTPGVVAAARATLTRALTQGPQNRKRLATELQTERVVTTNPLLAQQVAHLVYMAEIRGWVISGPLADGEHTYRLWTDAPPGRPRLEAIAELVSRFVGSHGPVSVRDTMRWVNLTKGEITQALDADPALQVVVVSGVELWHKPDSLLPEARPHRAHLLPTFDEVFLSHRDLSFPRAGGHPAGHTPYRFAEAGGGPVISDLEDVGSWKRTVGRDRITVTLTIAGALDTRRRSDIRRAAEGLAATLAPQHSPQITWT